MSSQKYKHHDLKIKQEYFHSLTEGQKKCEIRFNDRDFQTGDVIHFKPFDGVNFTSDHEYTFLITHVLHFPEGLKNGFVALSVEPL